MDRLPRTFAFATDHPHPEGVSGLDAYQAGVLEKIPSEHVAGFYGENMANLLRS